MKKSYKKIFSLFLALLTIILISINVFSEGVSYNFPQIRFRKLHEEKNQADAEVEKNNEEVAKMIKEKIGVDVKVKEGILSYEPERALYDRNNKVSKVIREANGIDVEATEGVLYIDPEEAKSNKNYKLPNISPIIIPDTLLSNYPYNKSNQNGIRNFLYSEYLFKLNTQFNSNAKIFHYADFYSQDDSYMFTISGNNVDDIYCTSLNIYGDYVNDYLDNNINSYYVIMYCDDSDSILQNVNYTVDCLLE